MTYSILLKIVIPSLLEQEFHILISLSIFKFFAIFLHGALKFVNLNEYRPVIDLNLYCTGMQYTTATFTAAMTNVLPAFAFLMAWALRLQKVDVTRLYSQAKIVGTIVAIGRAMLMTSIIGPS